MLPEDSNDRGLKECHRDMTDKSMKCRIWQTGRGTESMLRER
jgi:hypothetical protein